MLEIFLVDIMLLFKKIMAAQMQSLLYLRVM